MNSVQMMALKMTSGTGINTENAPFTKRFPDLAVGEHES